MMTLFTKEFQFHAKQLWRHRKVQSSVKYTLQIICHVACSSVHASRGASVRGPFKCYNFILKCPFFTTFALIPWRAPRETSENKDTDLANAMEMQSLWRTGCEVKQ